MNIRAIRGQRIYQVMTNLTASFQQYHPYFLHLAYNILGSRAEAEDIVQDVLVNVWEKKSAGENASNASPILNVKAYCGKAVVNRALTRKEAMQREIAESYWGVWLPEPLVSSLTEALPDNGAESHVYSFDAANAVGIGLLRLMEILTPLERAVYVLAELLEESYAETAQMLEITEAHARKLMERAKNKLEAGKKRFSATAERHQELFIAFAQATQEGRYDALHSLLKEDVVMYSDGGGKVLASRIVVRGVEKNLASLKNIAEWAAKKEPSTWLPCLLNGRLGAIAVHNETGRIITAMTLEADETGITEMYSVRNPDKLALLNKELRLKQA